MSKIDRLYRRTRAGDHEAFAAWVRLCEMPLRRSLRSFARGVDVESVLQEALLRMWRLAPTLAPKLEGKDASLRMALRMTRNLAISEARRLKRLERLDPENSDAEEAEQGRLTAPPDPALRRAVAWCIEKLPKKPRLALLARLSGEDDRALAARMQMRVNTFLQNIVRARKLMQECLEKKGIRLEEYLT